MADTLSELLDRLQRWDRIFYYRFWVKRDDRSRPYYLFKATATRKDGSAQEFRAQGSTRQEAVEAVLNQIEQQVQEMVGNA